MALSRFVVTSTTTIAAGTPATVAAGEPGTGAPAGPGNAAIRAGAVLFPATFIASTTIVLHPTGPLYAALSGGLRITCRAPMTEQEERLANWRQRSPRRRPKSSAATEICLVEPSYARPSHYKRLTRLRARPGGPGARASST